MMKITFNVIISIQDRSGIFMTKTNHVAVYKYDLLNQFVNVLNQCCQT